jgi:hypothetical protein
LKVINLRNISTRIATLSACKNIILMKFVPIDTMENTVRKHVVNVRAAGRVIKQQESVILVVKITGCLQSVRVIIRQIRLCFKALCWGFLGGGVFTVF